MKKNYVIALIILMSAGGFGVYNFTKAESPVSCEAISCDEILQAGADQPAVQEG